MKQTRLSQLLILIQKMIFVALLFAKLKCFCVWLVFVSPFIKLFLCEKQACRYRVYLYNELIS